MRRLVEPLIRDDDVALAAPVFHDQATEATTGRSPTLKRKLLRLANMSDTYEGVERRLESDSWEVDFTIGACQVLRRSAFESVGGLDESFFYGPEDVDFCLRLREAGWRIVQVRGAICDHPPRRRFRGLWTRRGVQHAWAVARHLWRHRGFRQTVGT